MKPRRLKHHAAHRSSHDNVSSSHCQYSVTALLARMKALHKPDDEPLGGVAQVEDDRVAVDWQRARVTKASLLERASKCITFCASYGAARKIAGLQHNPCYTPPVPPFEPRSRSKRTRFLASIRISDEEKKVVDWLIERLSEKDGEAYTSADVVRIALARLYEAEHPHRK